MSREDELKQLVRDYRALLKLWNAMPRTEATIEAERKWAELNYIHYEKRPLTDYDKQYMDAEKRYKELLGGIDDDLENEKESESGD